MDVFAIVFWILIGVMLGRIFRRFVDWWFDG